MMRWRWRFVAVIGALLLVGACKSSLNGMGDGATDAAVREGGSGDGAKIDGKKPRPDGTKPTEQGPPPDPGCIGCHGSATNLAPPASIGGTSATTERGVGAHQIHLAASSWHATFQCIDCHRVPKKVGDPGHIDTPLPAELTFSPLVSTGGAKPAWDGTTCSGTYCHGATLSGGTQTSPVWTTVDGSQTKCNSCHGMPPGGTHPANSSCSVCHALVVDASQKIINAALHINGKVESSGGHPTGWQAGSVHGVAFLKDTTGCGACHGPQLTGGSAQSCESCHAGWKTNCTFCHGGTLNKTGAPPKAVDGQTAITVASVGRHTAHVTAGATHSAYGCALCHVMPADALSPGHINGSAAVGFTGSATGGTYDTTTHLCTVSCHGNGKAGAKGTAPWIGAWTGGCKACHSDETSGGAMTLGGEHKKHVISKGYGCANCHSCVVDSSKQITDVTKHVNGVRDVCGVGLNYNPTTKGCTPPCHGTENW